MHLIAKSVISILLILALPAALFAGGDALGQVWLLILAPLVGAVLAVILWRLTRSSVEEPEGLVAGSERE